MAVPAGLHPHHASALVTSATTSPGLGIRAGRGWREAAGAVDSGAKANRHDPERVVSKDSGTAQWLACTYPC